LQAKQEELMAKQEGLEAREEVWQKERRGLHAKQEQQSEKISDLETRAFKARAVQNEKYGAYSAGYDAARQQRNQEVHAGGVLGDVVVLQFSCVNMPGRFNSLC
jgi:hypothetical protein